MENYGFSQEILSFDSKNLELSVSNDILTVKTMNKTSFIATVNNTGAEIVESVNISIEGIPNEWVSVFPPTKDILSGNVEKYLVVIDVPRVADAGVYQLKIRATDKIESNTLNLTLIIGRNMKEISDLLLKEVEKTLKEKNK
jgi:hypothetical protein